MTNRAWAQLAFTLLGIYFVANAAIGAASMPYIWQTSATEVRGMAVAVLFLPSLVALGVGLPVWLSAEWFAARLFPTESEPSAILSGQSFLAVAASILGLFLVAEGVPSLASALYLFGRSFHTGVLGADEARERLLWDASAKANALAGLVRLAIGLALLAGPTRLSAALARVRAEFGSHIDDKS